MINHNTNNKKHTESSILNSYGYYSKLLKTPFDSVEELKEAERNYYAEQKAKEDAAAQKKADALKVEEAFKALNQAKKDYKHNMQALTSSYCAELKKLKESLEESKMTLNTRLQEAENCYENELKTFSDKYGSFHLTLKDGDYETTISKEDDVKKANKTESDYISDIFKLFFGF
jgi:hypothetical protein